MYITRTDLEEAMSLSELTQLSQDDPLLANKEPDWAIVDRAIEYACEMADGYLQGRYTLPLAPTPSILRVICTDMARHWLHRRRINRAEFPKPLEEAHKNAIKVLESIRDGKIHLGIRGTGEATEAPQPESGAYHVRAKTKQSWGGY